MPALLLDSLVAPNARRSPPTRDTRRWRRRCLIHIGIMAAGCFRQRRAATHSAAARLSIVPSERQHVVSQVLLRRWAEDGFIRAVNLRWGTIAPKSPRAEGFVPWFVQSDFSTVIEHIWKDIEDRTPAVLDQVEDGTVFDSARRDSNIQVLRAPRCRSDRRLGSPPGDGGPDRRI